MAWLLLTAYSKIEKEKNYLKMKFLVKKEAELPFGFGNTKNVAKGLFDRISQPAPQNRRAIFQDSE